MLPIAGQLNSPCSGNGYLPFAVVTLQAVLHHCMLT